MKAVFTAFWLFTPVWALLIMGAIAGRWPSRFDAWADRIDPNHSNNNNNKEQ